MISQIIISFIYIKKKVESSYLLITENIAAPFSFPFPIMALNSSKQIIPSPSRSTPPIIFLHSAMLAPSPKLLRTLASSSAEINPFRSKSKTEKAFRRSSIMSVSSTPRVFNSMNSSRLMNPSLSESASDIIDSNSDELGTFPRLSNIADSSDDEILPSPLLSNFSNTRCRSEEEDVVVVDGDDGVDCRAVTDFRRKRYRRKKDLMLPIADSANHNQQSGIRIENA